MSRDINSSLSFFSELTGDSIEPFFAVEIKLDDTDGTGYDAVGYAAENAIYVSTLPYDVVMDSKNFLGAGNLLGISSIEETGDIGARGASLTFAGVPEAYISLALTESYQQRECIIYFGSVNDIGSITPPYVELFRGYLDQLIIEENAEAPLIQLTVESKLIDLERPRVRRYTAGDQKRRFDGDKGLNFVESIQDQPLFWGGRDPSSGGTGRQFYLPFSGGGSTNLEGGRE